MNSRDVFRRIAILPAVATLTVLAVALSSLLDLARTGDQHDAKKPLSRDADGSGDALLTLERRSPSVPRATEALRLSEGEALRRVESGRLHRAALVRLWEEPEHRALLFELLLAEDTPEEHRLYLLGRFESDEPQRAVEAARSMLREERNFQGPLLLAAFQTLARFGDPSDLHLLARERPFELHQTTRERERQRGLLLSRLEGHD